MRRKARTLEGVIRTRVNSSNYRSDKTGIPGRLDFFEVLNAYHAHPEPFDKKCCTHFCPFCQKKLSPSNLSLDHIIPVSLGGTNVLGNVWWTCLKCNRYRGNFHVKEFQEFLELLTSNGWLDRFFRHYRPRGYGGR